MPRFACNKHFPGLAEALERRGWVRAEAGAPVEAKDRDARTPLHLACLMTGKLEQTRGRDHVAAILDIKSSFSSVGRAPFLYEKYTQMSNIILRKAEVSSSILLWSIRICARVV